MVLIVCQKETGSALVYLSFFLVLYREGMTGSILFAGVCAIIYFIVGIRFSNELMADGLTSLGEFAVLGLIILFSALLVKAYCKNSDRAVVYILSFGLGSMLLGWLFRFMSFRLMSFICREEFVQPYVFIWSIYSCMNVFVIICIYWFLPLVR